MPEQSLSSKYFCIIVLHDSVPKQHSPPLKVIITFIVSRLLALRCKSIMNVQCTARFLHPQNHNEVPLSKAPNPNCSPQHKWLPTAPGMCSWCVCVCVFTAVCVHFGWVNCRAQIPIIDHHTWLYVTSLSSLKKI